MKEILDLKHDLLTREDEAALGRRIQAGLTSEDPAVQADGLAAKESLVLHNLRLVRKIASSYEGRGLDLDDLVSAGTIGLMRAADLYDPARGFKFSTYATNWIMQNMQRELDNFCSTIRVPVGTQEEIRSYKARVDDFEAEFGHPPAPEDFPQYDVEALEYAEQIQQTPSLDQPLTEDGFTLESVLPDDGPSTEDQMAQLWMVDKIRGVLESELTVLEATVIKLHWGVGGEHLTYKEIGEKFGRSTEGVRLIEHRALEKLRTPRVRRRLGFDLQ